MTKAAAPPRRIVVAGLGVAGLTVAEGLRRSGWDGELTLLSEERVLPYDRPPLSKQYLDGEHTAEKIALTTVAKAEALDATLLLGVSGASLDVESRTIIDTRGGRHRYDEAVIATGVRPRRIPAGDLTGVHVLRSRADADALRGALVPGARLCIIGGGLIGLEVAATAVKQGVQVTVVEPMVRPLANRLGEDIAGKLLELHAEHGVTVLSGVGVTEILAHDTERPQPYTGSGGEPGEPARVTGVRLTDDRILAADAVLVSIGVVPNTEWLEGSGLTVDNGVVTDEFCRAAPGVWAAGDVARWFNLALGVHVRMEHRMNATEQARAVAANIVGEPVAFRPVPFFWTDHYDVRLQFAGVTSAELAPEYLHGGLGEETFVAAWKSGDELLGVANWNAVKEMMPYRQQLARDSADRLARASA